MKPIYQTRFGHEEGNCFQACLASILELPLDAVPDVMQPADDAWLLRLNQWLRPQGWTAILIADWGKDAEGWTEGLLMIAGGLSPRSHGDIVTMHSVVWLNDQCVHDPIRGCRGLKGPPRDFTILLPQDPALHFPRPPATA